MKPIFLRFTDENGKITRTFGSKRLKTGMIDEIMDVALEASSMQENSNSKEMDSEQILTLKNIRERQRHIIIKLFGNQFTTEDIQENVDHEEIERVFTQIMNGIGGNVSKNSQRGKKR